MATCKDCIGYKYCSRGRNGKTNFYGEISACNNVEILCNDFKDTADVAEVKHGEWGDTGIKELDLIYSGYKCSECGDIICGNMTNYCSECGAKMDGGKDG